MWITLGNFLMQCPVYCMSCIIYESLSREYIVFYLKLYRGTTENTPLVCQRVWFVCSQTHGSDVASSSPLLWIYKHWHGKKNTQSAVYPVEVVLDDTNIREIVFLQAGSWFWLIWQQSLLLEEFRNHLSQDRRITMPTHVKNMPLIHEVLFDNQTAHLGKSL